MVLSTKALARVAAATMSLAAPIAGAGDLTELGRVLYEQGRLPDGTSLAATVQRDVALPPGATACASCHRRSGLGGAEGAVRVPPVTAAMLYSARSAARSRPAYTDETLLRAVVQGIAPDGAILGPLMPRYALDSRGAKALVAYMRTLGDQAAQGVDATSIRFATILSDDTPPATAAAIESVLTRFFELKNRGTRREDARAAAARRHQYGDRRDRAFRRWILDIWRLQGPASSWPAQLLELERQQTPFAIISGATGGDGHIVHEFCERRAIPCVLPLDDPPERAAQDFYSLYFSAGARLEGSVTASHLARSLGNSSLRVTIVRRGDAAGDAAWQGFSGRWRELGRSDPQQLVVHDHTDHGKLLARMRESQQRFEALVLWLDTATAGQVLQMLERRDAMPRTVYTAEVFANFGLAPAAAAAGSHLLHVYPFRLPEPSGMSFPRERAWLRRQHLENLDARIAGRVLFTCHIVGEQLSGIESNFSREYFLEGLEHMLDGTGMTTMYPRTALGPGQRFLSRGAYVVDRATVGSGPVSAAWVEL